MNILVALLTMGLLAFLGQGAVTLHKLTVCRQEAWRSSVILHTQTLLTKYSRSEKDILFRCGILVSRNEKRVSWTRGARAHAVFLRLSDRL